LQAQPISFELTGRLSDNKTFLAENQINARGWVDIKGKNMNAFVEFFDDEQHGHVKADVISKKNNMTIRGELSVNSEIALSEKKANISNETSMEHFLLGGLASLGAKVRTTKGRCR